MVGLQWQPAHGEQDDDNDQHLDDLLLVAQQCLVPLVLGIAGRLGAPQLDCHLDVDEADDTEGDGELHGDQHEAVDPHLLLRKVGPVAEEELGVVVVALACSG